MIELLILYMLNKKVLTMYGISKEIHANFSVLTTPSYGTIKPALNRLEKAGYVKSQKTMSKGGRPSSYYSITLIGQDELENLLLKPLPENPVQLITTSRIRLSCIDVLNKDSQKKMLALIKTKTESVMFDAKNLALQKENEFYQKMVLENLICECKNLILLLEGFGRAGNN